MRFLFLQPPVKIEHCFCLQPVSKLCFCAIDLEKIFATRWRMEELINGEILLRVEKSSSSFRFCMEFQDSGILLFIIDFIKGFLVPVMEMLRVWLTIEIYCHHALLFWIKYSQENEYSVVIDQKAHFYVET